MVSVYTGGVASGSLARSELQVREFLFRYDGSASEAVSLVMPVVADEYRHRGGLHPIFEMNLPEGQLREELRNAFAKTLPVMDDLALLEIVGRSQIGRIQCVRGGEELGEVPEQPVSELLVHRGARPLFEDLLRRFMRFSGVSGIQPKVLIRDRAEKVTHRGATHLVKAWAPDKYPELAANEYYCMQAARLAGLETPALSLSESGELLIVERFDLCENGYLGFEDFCALNGKSTAQKYEGSYERVARRIREFVSAIEVRLALESFFRSVTLSCAVGNGDAHLKNFGVTYRSTEEPVRLAPAFDIVCTRAYLPEDTLALTLDGTKRFPSRKKLAEFGIRSCGLSPRDSSAILKQVDEAVETVGANLPAAARDRPPFREVAQRMWRCWSEWLGERAPTVSFARDPKAAT